LVKEAEKVVKKHKVVRFFVVFVIFVLLFIVYILLKDHNEKSAEQAENLSEKIIFDINADDIKELTFFVEKDELNFLKKKEQWELKQDSDFPVDEEQMQVLTDALIDVKSSREIEDAKDLKEFGLLEPVNTIKVDTIQDNDSISITVGDTNAVTGDSYIYLNGKSDKVYMVDGDLATVFGGGLMNYAKETPYPTITGSNIIDIQMKYGEDGYQLKKNDDSSTGWYLGAQGKSQEEVPVDTVSAMQSAIAGLTYTNYYDYKCDDLSKFGLDKPFAVLTVKYMSATEVEGEEASVEDEQAQSEVKIVIGKEDGDGNRYVQVNDSNEVHGIASESISMLLDVQDDATL
jgi:hypothetical protein